MEQIEQQATLFPPRARRRKVPAEEAVVEKREPLLVAGLFAGIGHGVGFPLLTSAAVTDTPAHLRGAGMAALTAFWDLSSLVLTPLFGLVSDALSDAAMFAALAVLAALTAVVSRPAAPR